MTARERRLKQKRDHSKLRYQLLKETEKARARDWYHANKEQRGETVRAWRTRNPTYSRDYQRRRMLEIEYRIRNSLGSRIGHAVAGRGQVGSTLPLLLGCSIEELMVHLEGLFAPGMSWENYGEWHVDHKRPLKAFDLQDPEQVAQAMYFTNLQPLWAADNLAKGARY